MPDWQLTGAALGLAGALAGVAAHRRAAVRVRCAHLLMAAAMAAQAAPAYDPLGPAGWTLTLGLAAAWTLGRPGTRTPGHPPTALDLYAMAAAALVMPIAMPATHAHAASSAATPWGQTLYAITMTTWLLARAVSAAPRRPAVRAGGSPLPPNPATPRSAPTCALLMITGMTLMVL